MAIDVGDKVRLTAVFKDSDGNEIDPTAVAAEVKDPSGNTDSYTYDPGDIVKSATGTYYVDIDIDEAGTWYYRFYSTGTGKAAEESYFVVSDSKFS